MVPCVYVLSDMEGSFGITSMAQCVPGSRLWQEARKNATLDAVAAAQGAQAAGAKRVIIHDTHAWGVNLVASLVPPSIELKRGHYSAPVPILGQVPEDSLMLAVAAHVGAGTDGHLPHTFRTRFESVEIDGRKVGETELYAGLVAPFGVRMGLVTGHDCAVAEAEEALPWIVGIKVPRKGDEELAHKSRGSISEGAERAVRQFPQMELHRFGEVTMSCTFKEKGEAQRHHIGKWQLTGETLTLRGHYQSVFKQFLDMAYLGHFAFLGPAIIAALRPISRWRFS